MKIILVRHAKVLLSDSSACDASQMRDWVDAYDHAPIDEMIPEGSALMALVQKSDRLVCSGLLRSKKSLALLGHTPDLEDPIFDEVAVPRVKWKGAKLKPRTWLLLFRIASLFGYRGEGESLKDAKIRARAAADRLIRTEASYTVLIGHGLMNHFIAKELKQRGWRETRALGRGHWSYGIFEQKETV